MISYSRRFTVMRRSLEIKRRPSSQSTQNAEFSEKELLQHTWLLPLRNQALAHSKFSRKSTGRVMGTATGFLVQLPRPEA